MHEAVMPRRDVVDELALLRPDRAEENRPAQHLGVADLVELRAGHVEQRVGVAGFELRHEPAIEIEFRVQVLGRAGEMRHAAARDDRDAFLAALDDLGQRLAERLAPLGRRQRRHVDVGEERDDRDVALADHVFERHRERVAELGVLRIRQVEVVVGDQLVQDVFRHLAVDRHDPLASREPRHGVAAGDDRERGHAADGERLDVIGAEEDDDVGLGLVEHLAQLLHRRAGLIQLLRVLVRRTREHVRGMARPDGRNDFSHGSSPSAPALSL